MSDVKKETEQKIAQLQMMEQNIQTFMMQRQNFQAQQLEVDNALKELEISKGDCYKMVGSIMVAADKDKLKKDLESRKEIVELRLKNIKKQEDSIKEKAEKLQSEVIKELKPAK
ncbi:MAG: prefoldin subunit beta [Nanoarchaeota archaeon]|nr:prefoldin subunit beta [Nanoarchaeota archaeon]MBU4352308.1 prefoldin subunit beta [Nanoarchaeota archaeon]MBU4456739.1 prefoldin subunit beta [Nanoarchaeota archaeon]MCG2719171.1 prefoldin subunit beta [Nanoarchaeota archaeon]